MIDILAGRLFYISIFLLSFLHPGLSGYAAEITVTLTPRKVEKHEGGSSQIDKLNQLLQQQIPLPVNHHRLRRNPKQQVPKLQQKNRRRLRRLIAAYSSENT
jgi:hypothetical protein